MLGLGRAVCPTCYGVASIHRRTALRFHQQDSVAGVYAATCDRCPVWGLRHVALVHPLPPLVEWADRSRGRLRRADRADLLGRGDWNSDVAPGRAWLTTRRG